MSIVTLRDVVFLNNPAKFGDPYNFKITFECIAPLKEDLEWRVIFVASPDREELDQELDDCMVGPVPPGVNVFEFEASPPNPSTIPKEDVLGVAAVILTGTYKDQEFVRVGYYQNTEYDSEELNENPPAEIDFSRLRRELANKPRVTRFSIKWYVFTFPAQSRSNYIFLFTGIRKPQRLLPNHLYPHPRRLHLAMLLARLLLGNPRVSTCLQPQPLSLQRPK
ncbi:Histone chaperone asf1 [Ceratobasidium sp. 394]|nr:Histone chaperone asf1 [Ceratobasidium sp. 394]